MYHLTGKKELTKKSVCEIAWYLFKNLKTKKGVKIISTSRQSKFIHDYFSLKSYDGKLYRLDLMKNKVLRPGFEEEKDIFKRPRGTANPEKLDNNLTRVRTKIFEYALCNDFHYFVTLTLDPVKYDRYDLKKYIKDLGQFIRDYRKKYKCDIQYLLIPEQHKNGAWHMHGLIKGIPMEHLTLNENRFLDWSHYSDKFGYISLDIIKDVFRCAKYITKYVSKDLKHRELNSKAYYSSRGLKCAETMKKGSLLTVENLDVVGIGNLNFDFENDYILRKEFSSKANIQKLKNLGLL